MKSSRICANKQKKAEAAQTKKLGQCWRFAGRTDWTRTDTELQHIPIEREEIKRDGRRERERERQGEDD